MVAALPQDWRPTFLMAPTRHEADDGTRARMRRQLRDMCVRANAELVDPGSVAESVWLLDFVLMSVEWLKDLDEHPGELLIEGYHGMTDDALRGELGTESLELRLSWRHVQKALDIYGTVVEMSRSELEDLDLDTLLAALDAERRVLDEGERVFVAEQRVLLRLQACLVVAFEAAKLGDDQGFIRWARETQGPAGALRAQLHAPLLAHQRAARLLRDAQTSWDDWDEADIEAELAPWPTRR